MTITGQFPAETSADGAFVRQRYAFRDRITADGLEDLRLLGKDQETADSLLDKKVGGGRTISGPSPF